MKNKVKKFEEFLNEEISGVEEVTNPKKKITIRSTRNELFHYDIYLDENEIVTGINNQWHVKLPVWIDMPFQFLSLKVFLNKKEPSLYIEE